MSQENQVSFLAQWLIDISSISSIVGLVITIFLLIEAKHIRKSFLRRARLPEVIKDLNVSIKKISSNLKSWQSGKNTVNEQYGIVRGLLENISLKLPDDERAQVQVFIKQLYKYKYYVFKESLIIEDEELGWRLYTDLSRISTRLEQLQKDIRWD